MRQIVGGEEQHTVTGEQLAACLINVKKLAPFRQSLLFRQSLGPRLHGRQREPAIRQRGAYGLCDGGATTPPDRPCGACGRENRASACGGGYSAGTCASFLVNPLKRKR